MRTHPSPLSLAALLAAPLGALACADAGVTTPDADATITVTLHAPAPDVVIAQNDPTIGCTPHATRGYGLRIAFSWSPPATGGAPAAYHLLVKREGAQYPLFDGFVAGPSFTMTGCHSFVIDRSLDGWFWQVTPVASGGALGPPSEARPFAFHPCRLVDGRACYAPPEG